MNPADQDNLKLSKSNFISSKTIPISKEYTMGKTLGSGALEPFVWPFTKRQSKQEL